MHFRVVIPARYASSRLPGKPLADIGGRPMVLRVLERALQSGAESVVVATDDMRVQQAVEAAGYQALMTSATHASGTERLVEVAEALAWPDDTLVVNVQGDEPLIDPELIRAAARQLVLHDDAVMACVVNFSGGPHESYRIGLPFGGTWNEVVNTDAEAYGGSGVGNLGAVHAEEVPWHGRPFSAVVR